LEDSDDPEERERCRTIARWIKLFLTTAREYILDADEALRHPVPEGDPEYMPYDSDGGSSPGESD
jgi:hypothetical protein